MEGIRPRQGMEQAGRGSKQGRIHRDGWAGHFVPSPSIPGFPSAGTTPDRPAAAWRTPEEMRLCIAPLPTPCYSDEGVVDRDKAPDHRAYLGVFWFPVPVVGLLGHTGHGGGCVQCPGGAPGEVYRRYPLNGPISPPQKMQRGNRIAELESNCVAPLM